jgi:hypothetical protein
MVVHHSLLHRSSAGSMSLEEVWSWWGLPRQWNGLWFIWLLHANILLFDVCRIASDSWAYWVPSCNDNFLKSLNCSGSHAISTMCRRELSRYFDVLVVPVCRLLVRTSMLRRVRVNGHLGLFLMWVWSGLQLETEFLVPWRYLSTYVFCAYSHSKVY